MGIDIRGWIEVHSPLSEVWSGAVRVSTLADRNYEVFALFGIRQRRDFPPVAARRGLPNDVSAEAKTDYEAAITAYPREFHSPTWLSWAELQSVDWNERVDDRVLEWQKGWSPGVRVERWKANFLEHHSDRLPEGAGDLRAGQTWEQSDNVYQVEETRRSDVLEGGWILLFRLMEVLADKYTSDGVRMVVWFDG